MSDCSTNAFKVPQKPVLNEPPLNIDEIREEIPKALGFKRDATVIDWIRNSGRPDYEHTHPVEHDVQTAARMLVDWAYEAGKADAFPSSDEASLLSLQAYIEAHTASCNEYQRGYEAGKAEGIEEGFKNGRSFIEKGLGEDGLQAIKDTVAYQEGYEAAAKNPKAWYVIGKDGEHLHIYDKVKSGDSIKEITGLGDDQLFAPYWNAMPASRFEKVTTDTREQIVNELSNLLENGCLESKCHELAEQFVSRVEVLAVDE